MKCAVLFSGGKDSTYAAYLLKKDGYEISCLISIFSENPESYMFHTPSISQVKKQSDVMNIPIIVKETKGEKEKELKDLKEVIKEVKKNYKIDIIASGAVESEYQSSRIQKICNDLKIDCINPLWKYDQIKLLYSLIDHNFKVIITGVFAYPFDKSWLGRELDKEFIKEISDLYEKYKINPAGEGGEYETFVTNCPLFSKELKFEKSKIIGNKNSWKMEISII